MDIARAGRTSSATSSWRVGRTLAGRGPPGAICTAGRRTSTGGLGLGSLCFAEARNRAPTQSMASLGIVAVQGRFWPRCAQPTATDRTYAQGHVRLPDDASRRVRRSARESRLRPAAEKLALIPSTPVDPARSPAAVGGVAAAMWVVQPSEGQAVGAAARTSSTTASTSASVVRWLVIQARSTKCPRTVALER